MELSPQEKEKAKRRILAYQADPLLFCKEVLGRDNYWGKQIEVLRSVAKNKRTEVHSGHDVGKTYVAADVALWFLYCFQPSIVITTAPTWRQVEKVLWGEINSHWGRAVVPLGGKALETEIKLGPKHYAIGFSSDKPDAYQGFHERNILVIEDEPSGIPDEVDEQIQTILANENAKLLKIGNPVRKTGHFAKSIESQDYSHIRINCWESPNVVADRIIYPSLVTKAWCEERLREWGEDSPVYQSRVLGLVPSEDVDTLIKIDWIEASILRHAKAEGKLAEGQVVISCDVARFGNNLTVVMVRQGRRILKIQHYAKQDTETTADVIYILYSLHHPDFIVIDDNGVGGGVTDKLKIRYKLKNVVAENSSEKADDSDKYHDRRSELGARVRDAFKYGEIDIPDSEKLVFECNNQFFDMDSKDRLRIMSKTLMKRKGLESPDFFDALALSYAREIPEAMALESAQYHLEFFDAKHVQDLGIEKMLYGISKYQVLVPSLNGHSALIWAAADAAGRIYIYREALVDRTSSSAIHESIAKVEEGELIKVEERIVPKTKLPDEIQKNNFHLLEQLEDYDYLYDEVEYDFDTAGMLLREALKAEGMPYLFIHPACKYAIHSVKYYLDPKQFENDPVHELFHKAVGALVLSEPAWSKAGYPTIYMTRKENGEEAAA